MLVQIQPDDVGNIALTIVNSKLRKKFEAAKVPSGIKAELFTALFVPERKQSALRKGVAVNILMGETAYNYYAFYGI